jgi:hypothetical protein
MTSEHSDNHANFSANIRTFARRPDFQVNALTEFAISRARTLSHPRRA